MFWELTPASSVTLQPSTLSALPPSLQQCATHSRCLQRVVFLLPKILAFLLVAGECLFVGVLLCLLCCFVGVLVCWFESDVLYWLCCDTRICVCFNLCIDVALS